MELIINIPEERYKEIVESDKPVMIYRSDVAKVLVNGTPLPKGHGRIGDLDRLCQVFERNVVGGVFRQLFDMAPTIIEADKEGE